MRRTKLHRGNHEAGLRLRPLKPGQARGPRRLVPWWVRAMQRARAAQIVHRQPKSSVHGGGGAVRRPGSRVRL